MNKYVVIPHEQYESFKSFLAGKKDIKIAESKQETLDESKSEKNKGKEFVDSKIINNNNINSENFLHNTRKETVISQASDKAQDKAEFTHPLPPPGLPEAGVYTQENYFSKIIIKKKKWKEIQKGSGTNEWIKKSTKKF